MAYLDDIINQYRQSKEVDSGSQDFLQQIQAWDAADRARQQQQQQQKTNNALFSVLGKTSPYLTPTYQPGTISQNFPSNNVVNQNLGTLGGVVGASAGLAKSVYQPAFNFITTNPISTGASKYLGLDTVMNAGKSVYNSPWGQQNITPQNIAQKTFGGIFGMPDMTGQIKQVQDNFRKLPRSEQERLWNSPQMDALKRAAKAYGVDTSSMDNFINLKGFNVNKPAQAAAGKVADVANAVPGVKQIKNTPIDWKTVIGAPGGIPGIALAHQLPGGSITLGQILNYGNNNIIKPTAESFGRAGQSGVGVQTYDNNTQGWGQLGSDISNILSAVYVGGSATELGSMGAKELLGNSAKSFGKQFASGATTDVLNQLAQGKKLSQIDLAQTVTTGGLYGLLGTGLPLAGKLGELGQSSLARDIAKQVDAHVAKKSSISTIATSIEKTIQKSNPDTVLKKGDILDALKVELKSISPQELVASKGLSKEQIAVAKLMNDRPELFMNKADFAKQYVNEQAQAQDQAAKADSKGLVARTAGEIKQKGVDMFAPIETPVNKATGGFYSKESSALRKQIARALRSDTIGGQFLRDSGFDKVIQSIDKPKEFNQYLIAKRALEVEKQGKKTGRDLAKDKALVEALAPKYEAQAKMVNEYTQQLLDKSVEYGLISKELAAKLKKDNPNYVPLERIFKDGEIVVPDSVGAGKASLSSQSVVKKMKGSEREIQNPLESILNKTRDVFAQGERNKAAQAIVDTMKIEGNPLGLRELAKGEVIGTKPTISFLDKGVKRTFETTPEIATAAKNLNPTQLGLLGKILSYPTRLLRLGATGLNPAFAAANVVKDLGTAFINSQHAVNSLANPHVFMQSLAAATFHRGKAYQELVREGAGGTSFDIARESVKHTLKEVRAEKNLGTKIVYNVTHPGELLRAVEDIIGRSEEFSRAAQYYGNKGAALKAGMTESEAKAFAADAARNNTVDFARAGEYGRVLNTTLPYLNAGIQGSRTLMRNLKERPVQTGSKIALVAFLPMAATTAWNISDPQRRKAYDSINDYEKQNNLIIIPPNPKQESDGRWNVIKIPISQEIANLANIVRLGVMNVKDKSMPDFAQMAGDLIGTATSLNAGSPRQIANQITPQALKPMLESMTNQNLFTGNTIVPDAMKNLEAKNQFNKNTSGLAKVLGRLTNLSPLQIDNAIKTSTGGLGQNLTNIMDNVLAKTGVIKPEEVGGKSFGESISGRFTSAQGMTQGAEFYKSIDDAAKKLHVAGKDLNLLNSILSKEVDGDGNPIKSNEQDSLTKYSILANNPRVFEALGVAAKDLAQKTGKPYDPIYDLNTEQQKNVLAVRSLPPGSDDWAKKELQKQPWYQDFQKKESSFFNSLNLPQKEGGRPQPSGYVQAMMDGGNFSDPAVKAYLQNNTQYTNDLRSQIGFLTPDMYQKQQQDIIAGAEQAKTMGEKLKYMQNVKLSGNPIYDKFFASNPNLDPTSGQFQGFKSGGGGGSKNYASMRAKASLTRSIKSFTTSKKYTVKSKKVKIPGAKKFSLKSVL